LYSVWKIWPILRISSRTVSAHSSPSYAAAVAERDAANTDQAKAAQSGQDPADGSAEAEATKTELEKIFGPGLLSTDTLDRLLGEDKLPGKADCIRRLTAGRAEAIACERRLLAALEDAAAACVWLFLL
jgi:hypothetical protein